MALIRTTHRYVSFTNRYPNRWSTRASVWTPKGTKMEIEGPLPEAVGELVLAALSTPDPDPKLAASMKRLAKRLRDSRTAKN